MANKINSRSKGNKFERNISKILSKWAGYEFGRVPGSGSLRWKKTDNISGDIVCTDPKHSRRFPFNIECKSYQDIKFEHLLLGLKSCKISSFWDQCTNDAFRSGKVPMLIMRYNSMPRDQAFVILDYAIGNPVEERTSIPFIKIYTPKGERLYIFLLQDLITSLEYNYIYKVAKSYLKLCKPTNTL